MEFLGVEIWECGVPDFSRVPKVPSFCREIPRSSDDKNLPCDSRILAKFPDHVHDHDHFGQHPSTSVHGLKLNPSIRSFCRPSPDPLRWFPRIGLSAKLSRLTACHSGSGVVCNGTTWPSRRNLVKALERAEPSLRPWRNCREYPTKRRCHHGFGITQAQQAETRVTSLL